jgi:hypothetical protein
LDAHQTRIGAIDSHQFIVRAMFDQSPPGRTPESDRNCAGAYRSAQQ